MATFTDRQPDADVCSVWADKALASRQLLCGCQSRSDGLQEGHGPGMVAAGRALTTVLIGKLLLGLEG